jgi:EAL domain-containing protein (putative c-di-GMP-specific phosphodiesterase class I)
LQGSKRNAAAVAVEEAPQHPRNAAFVLEPADPAEGVRPFDDTRREDSAELRAAIGRVRAALRRDEFRLYRQTIRDLSTGDAFFQGIFVRQAEEEEIRLPPGMFLALTAQLGLQGELDRWVVRRVLEHDAAQRGERRAPAMYAVSLSRDSIAHPYFPAFVRDALGRAGTPAEVLCFEMQEADVQALRVDAAELARRLRSMGARVLLGGFARDKPSLELLKEMPVDFIKIDGSIIFNVGRSEAALDRVRSIVPVAHALGINTVAELVESQQLAAQLRELEVDYAQGVGVSPAVPLFGLAPSTKETA